MYNALEDIILAISIPVCCIFNIQYKHCQIKIFGGPERFEAVTRMSQLKILCTISTIADRENVWRTSLILNRNWVIEKFHLFVKTITCNCYFTDLAWQIVIDQSRVNDRSGKITIVNDCVPIISRSYPDCGRQKERLHTGRYLKYRYILVSYVCTLHTYCAA